MAPSISDISLFNDILCKVQRERDHCRSVAAQLRDKNDQLLKSIEHLMAQLSNEKSGADGQCYSEEEIGHVQNELSSPECHTTAIEEGQTSPGSEPGDRGQDDAPCDGGASTYTKGSPTYPFYRSKAPKDLLVLSPERIYQCLATATRVPSFSPSQVALVSRQFLIYRGLESSGGVFRLQMTDSSGCVTVRRLLLGSESLYFPIQYGSPGLLLSAHQEPLQGSAIWSCFAPMPQVASNTVLYVGDYRLRLGDTMSVEEYASQRTEAKRKVVRLMFPTKIYPAQKTKGKKARGQVDTVQQERKKYKDALVTGQEKIGIMVMEFVSYDAHFAEAIQTLSDGWKRSHRKYGRRSAMEDESDS
ncbi:hypothetical protein F5I97DRAFT_225894 [Phlebopus sp. FC_14]|nr:hypothetical protein F5I97DRAFT_225894 [Phlebopus sp. FC_14]